MFIETTPLPSTAELVSSVVYADKFTGVYRDYTFCLGSTAELCCILLVYCDKFVSLGVYRDHLCLGSTAELCCILVVGLLLISVSIETTPLPFHSRTVLYPSRWFTADKFVSLGVSIETTPFALGPQPNCAVS
ncbi:hypothetical protein J6590_105699 [Homalodisca vitripennis]|nr:hypothetical protein J6590_105699 [Homalodisca vitripennis]